MLPFMARPAPVAAAEALRLPFANGEQWCVWQGYNSGTHTGFGKSGLDITYGATCNSTTSDGRPVLSPVSGTIAGAWYASNPEGVCINFGDRRGSMVVGHFDWGGTVSIGQEVDAGQRIGFVHEAPSADNPTEVDHLHLDVFSDYGCPQSVARPDFSGANAIGCNSLPNTGGANQYQGTVLTNKCASSGPDSFGGETFEATRLSFQAGTHTGYKFNSAGTITSSKSSTLPSSSAASATRRAQIPTRTGTWFYVIDGIWAGYWVRESTSVYMSWSPARDIHWDGGTYTGYTFNATGGVTGSKAGTIASGGSSAEAGGIAVINGRNHYRINNGIWAGYWMPSSGRAFEVTATASIHFNAGTHTGYQFNHAGTTTATKAGSIASGGSGASANGVVKVGSTWYYHITNGIWANYWVKQTAASYRVLSPEASIHFDAGTHTGYRYSATGSVTASKNGTIGSGGSSAPARAHARINGQSHYLISAGIWDEYWVRESADIYPS
jgi:hypothetical protein